MRIQEKDEEEEEQTTMLVAVIQTTTATTAQRLPIALTPFELDFQWLAWKQN